MLNQTKFLPYFPMLKDREKILEQDIIWKQICNDLEWNYIPTTFLGMTDSCLGGKSSINVGKFKNLIGNFN